MGFETDKGLKNGFPLTKIRYMGFFEWNDLYKMMKSFLKSKKYSWEEPKYKHKPPDMEFKFVGDKKVDEYFKHKFVLVIKIFDYIQKEVIENGEKVKKNYGRLEIQVEPHTEAYYKRWDEVRQGEKLGGFFEKQIIKKKFDEEIEDANVSMMLNLIFAIKGFLKMTC